MQLKRVFNVLRGIDLKDVSLIIVKDKDSTTRSVITLSNVLKFKDFLSQVEFISSLQETIDILKLSPLYGKYGKSEDLVRLQPEAWQEISKLQSRLFLSISIILNTICDSYKETTECTITLKLPDPRDLDDMINTLKTVQTIFAQNLHNEKIKGVVQIESWETGSFWIDLFVGTQAAVVLVGSIAWAAAVINKKRQEGLIIEEYVKGLKIKNNSLEDIRKGQEEAIQLLIERETHNIQSEHFGDKDPEQFERLKMAIRTMADLIKRGTEIHPSLTAPEQVKNLFPDTKHLESIESRVKLLDNKKDKSEEDNSAKE